MKPLQPNPTGFGKARAGRFFIFIYMKMELLTNQLRLPIAVVMPALYYFSGVGHNEQGIGAEMVNKISTKNTLT
jgi:hypothetical protein